MANETMPMPALPGARPAQSQTAGNGTGLSKRQKAAIVVRLLIAEGVDIDLKALPESLQEELTHQMSGLRFVDHETVADVITEFAQDVDRIGLFFPRGLDGALGLLGDKISPSSAAKLRKQAGGLPIGDPWERIGDMSCEKLLEVAKEESIEVAAVLLSKLKVSKAAEILGSIPGEQARRIAYAVSQTGAVEPQVVLRIGQSISAQLDTQPLRAFDDGPVERVGAILNFSPAATREDVLTGLEETDAGFAEQVRKAIFTFENIPARLDPRDIPKITRELDAAILVTALASATGEAEKSVEFILGNMSQRMATNLRDEITSRGAVKPKDGEAAMSSVVSTIRELEASGEIFLVAEDE